MSLMQLQVKLQKTAEITYLEANKQQTKDNIYRVTRGFEVRKKLRLMFRKDSMKGKCYVVSGYKQKK